MDIGRVEIAAAAAAAPGGVAVVTLRAAGYEHGMGWQRGWVARKEWVVYYSA